MSRSSRSGADGGRPMKRAPFRAWLVTGPVGRLVGFMVEFSSALFNLAKARYRR